MSKRKEVPGIAVLVSHGVYQYVRLPKEFRFEGDQVQISKHRSGVVLKPLPSDEPKRKKTSANE